MRDSGSVRMKVEGADKWVRDRFVELERLAADFGCVPADERGPGRAFRVDGRRVLRVHPKRRHLALGFPEALRSDVAVLTGALRAQRGSAWVNYGPDGPDPDTIELLLAAAVRDLPTARGLPAAPESSETDGATPEADTAVRTGAPAVTSVARTSRGARDDEADLSLVLAVLLAFSDHERATGRADSVRVLRETVYFHWEGPRLPPGRKYAPSLLHSPAARQRRDAGDSTGLVYEHAVPVSLLMRELLADPPRDNADLRARLEAAGQRIVITQEEDRTLTALGWRDRMPDRADVWSRYRAVGMDPGGFAPWQPGADANTGNGPVPWAVR